MGVFTIDHYVKNKYDRIKINAQYESQRFGLDYETVLNQSLRVLEETKGDYTDEQGTSGFIRFYNKLLFDLCSRLKKQKYADKASDKDKSEFEKKIEAVAELSETQKSTQTQKSLASYHTQVCTTCDLTKPIEEFYKNISVKGGRTKQCKLCIKKNLKTNKSENKGVVLNHRIDFHSELEEKPTEESNKLSLNNLNEEELTALEAYYTAKYNVIVDRLDTIKELKLKYKQS